MAGGDQWIFRLKAEDPPPQNLNPPRTSIIAAIAMGSAPASPASLFDQLRDFAGLGRNFFGQTFHLRARRQVVAGGHRRARFLQGALRIGVHAARGFEVAGGDACRFGDLDLFVQLPLQGQGPTDRRFGRTTHADLAIGGLPRRLERALVGVDCPRQRQAVVPLLDGFVCLLHGGGRGREWLRRVLFGAGGACRLDGTLGAIDFFLGRFGTGGEKNQRADRSGETTHRPAV